MSTPSRKSDSVIINDTDVLAAAIREAHALGQKAAIRSVEDAVGGLAVTVDAASLRETLKRLRPQDRPQYRAVLDGDKLTGYRLSVRGVDLGPVQSGYASEGRELSEDERRTQSRVRLVHDLVAEALRDAS